MLKHKKLTKFFLIFLIAFSLLLTQSSMLEAETTQEKIIILHTQDEHGTIANSGRLAYEIDRIRGEYDNVFLFNSGDIFSGNPIVDQFDPQGYPMIELMNEMGYDLLAIGNHEFDFGQEVMIDRMEQANFPWINANIEVTDEGIIPQPEPYARFTTDEGTVMKVLSMIQVREDTGFPSTSPIHLEGLVFHDPLEVAEEYKYLAEESDLFIGLTHMGDSSERALAEMMEDMVVLMGGHSHATVEGDEINNTLYTRAGWNQENLGKIKLTLEDGELVNKESRLIPTEDIPYTDVRIEEMLAAFEEELDLDVVLSNAPEPIRGDRYENGEVGPQGRHNLGALVTDSLRKTVEDHGYKADIAFYNIGGIRIPEIHGDVTLGTVYELEPFGSDTVLIEMTTDQIRSFIEHSTNRRDAEHIDVRVSGIHYHVYVDDGEIVEIELTDYDGNPIDEDQTYNVVFSDYLGISGAYEFDYDEENVNQLYNPIADFHIEFFDGLTEEDLLEYVDAEPREYLIFE